MSKNSEDVVDPYAEFRVLVGKRLEEISMSGKTLADALGVSSPWVSQLISGPRVKPSPQKIVAIANILGHELLNTIDESLYKSRGSLQIGPEFPLLWSSRIKLLRSLADGETAKDKQGKRERLRTLAREIEDAAVRHPLGIQHRHGTSIAVPRDLAKSVEPIMKQQILCELAFMKIDAPLSLGIDRENFLLNENSYLADLASDFELSIEDISAIRDVWKYFIDRSRLEEDTYSNLNSCGGFIGEMNFLTSESASEMRSLVGFDLVGWTDMSFISGSWLVRNLNLNQYESISDSPPKSVLPKWAAAFNLGQTRNASSTTSSLFLGDVVSEAINYYPSNFSYPNNVTGKFAEPSLGAIAMACIFLGHSWVRIEVAKLIAFYATSFTNNSDNWEEYGFPDPWEFEEVLGDIVTLFDSLAKSEKLASSRIMQDHKRNRQYRDLIDIRDTFELAHDYLSAYREKHFKNIPEL